MLGFYYALLRCTHYLVPLKLLRLLVNFLSNVTVYAVFELAYVFPENQHRTAILVCIETTRFFQRSHDFALAALQWRMAKIIACSLFSLI